jgi:hypothetical protein
MVGPVHAGLHVLQRDHGLDARRRKQLTTDLTVVTGGLQLSRAGFGAKIEHHVPLITSTAP